MDWAISAEETTMADTPDDTEVMDEREGIPPRGDVMVAPPTSVASTAPHIAPDPANGPAGFASYNDYLNAYDAARKQAIQQMNEQQQFNQLIQQSARTEDALKAVAAARKFIATRRLQNDFQSALSSGVPAEKAWALSAARNLDAFGGNLNPVTSAMRMSVQKPASEQQPLSDVATPIYDPSGNVLGYRAQTSANAGHIQWVPRTSDVEGKLTDVEKHRIKSLEDEKKELSKNLVSPSLLAHPVNYLGGNKEYKSSTNRIAQIQKEISGILDSAGKKESTKSPKTYVYKDGKLVEKQ